MKIQFRSSMTLFFAAVLVAVVVLWQVQPSRGDDPVTDKPGGKNSPSISAGGNITIGHIGDIINQAPAPELKLGTNKTEKNADGAYILTVEVEVVSPYPPASLALEVWGTGITDFRAIPQRAGLMMGGPRGVRPDHAFATVMQPFGKYVLVIQTKDVPKIEVKYDFNK